MSVRVALVAADQARDVLPDHVRGGAVEERPASRVGVPDAAIAIDCHDGIGHGIENRVREFRATPLGVASALSVARPRSVAVCRPE
jgi:hypothetical protein